ncbi:D-serine ammonia-lyase [Paenibacillus sp. 1P07SE]|uniref:D-serine ammonia-lyase n=1 Tax=Paenibacillus sp. 1P07SE TaxID=3132209 RepID=UPI0039A4120B
MYAEDRAVWLEMLQARPVAWRQPRNGHRNPDAGPGRAALEKAVRDWERFAPLIRRIYADSPDGRIRSPLKSIGGYHRLIQERTGTGIAGEWLVKCDHELTGVGSIKARGGIYEVLAHAEELALQHGVLAPGDSLERLAEPQAQSLFGSHEIVVGSTGNLGISIGMTSAALGFHTVIHMSREAKAWKKQLLRKRGALVIEHEGDFAAAVEQGRRHCEGRAGAYFVDDEHSERLFLGYAAAAYELAEQLAERGAGKRAIHVYLPCGVGGSPAGIAYGLRQVLGDRATCWFAEPTHAPSMLAALMSGRYDGLHLAELGLFHPTVADGLAVPVASRLAAPVAAVSAAGIYTVRDEEMLAALADLYSTEHLRVEPSAAASLLWPLRMPELCGEDAIHISWLTGGALLPAAEFEALLEQGSSNRQVRQAGEES